MNKRLLNQAIQVRDLLSDRARWGTNDIAVDANDLEVAPSSPKACRFCLIGGIGAVLKCRTADSAYDNVPKHPLGKLIGSIIEGVYAGACDREPDLNYISEGTLYGFNDSHTHEEVMEVLDTAVALIEGATEAGVRV